VVASIKARTTVPDHFVSTERVQDPHIHFRGEYSVSRTEKHIYDVQQGGTSVTSMLASPATNGTTTKRSAQVESQRVSAEVLT